MERKTMISEIVGAKAEMFSDDPKGNPYTLKNVTLRNTKTLVTLHKKTMEEYRLWREEQERLASLPKDLDTLLAVQAGLINQDEAKEIEMAKDEKKKASQKGGGKATAPKKPEPSQVDPVESIEARALKAMNVVLWPSEVIEVESMSPTEVELDVKDNVESIKPGDKEAFLKARPEDGEEVWAYLSGLNKALLSKEEKKVKAKAEKKAEKKVKTPSSNIELDEFGFRMGSNGHKFVEYLKTGSKTMRECQDAEWNPTRATFMDPLKKLIEAGKAIKAPDGKISLIK